MKMPCGSSSAGEKHRVRQLLRQLPPQDSKASYCIGLSDEEKNEFHLFQNSRKRDALGRGSVCPLPESAQNRLCAQVSSVLSSYRVLWWPGTLMTGYFDDRVLWWCLSGNGNLISGQGSPGLKRESGKLCSVLISFLKVDTGNEMVTVCTGVVFI